MSAPTVWSTDFPEGELDQFAIAAPHIATADIIGHVLYFLKGVGGFGGECSAADATVAGQRVIFDVDWTKSRRDDLYDVLTDPARGLLAFLHDGSPIRTTNQAGPGTQGTRKLDGLPGPIALLWANGA